MNTPFIGTVISFGGNFAPRGWALCNGQLLSISENQALFSLLGTIYGGDGRTTFALPDLRGRQAIGVGRGPGMQDIREGQKGGAESKTLTTTEMPQHNHSAAINAGNDDVLSDTAAGNRLANEVRGGGDVPLIYTSSPNAHTLAADAITVNHQGGGQSFNTQEPYLGVNFIIALQGVYPSRN